MCQLPARLPSPGLLRPKGAFNLSLPSLQLSQVQAVSPALLPVLLSVPLSESDLVKKDDKSLQNDLGFCQDCGSRL
ncbi:uncharacterized protein LOC135579152 isoform X3 [Columba livia]|uniref:uncharacterized protein LOC135579152 isoform X3 n=1 Tax=Columba livia TaxID=8932 RepID=UPI0031BAA688